MSDENEASWMFRSHSDGLRPPLSIFSKYTAANDVHTAARENAATPRLGFCAGSDGAATGGGGARSIASKGGAAVFAPWWVLLELW